MGVRTVTADDLDWVVAVLAERRKRLIPHAPIFWHPSRQAARIHRAYLARLLTQAGARGYRTDTAVLIAAPSPPGWIVDDALVPYEQWGTPDADALWCAFTTDCSGDPVRFVSPCYEQERGAFAVRAGLTLTESWWLKELPGSQGGQAGLTVDLAGASAVTAGAPPIYAPPGPMLLLTDVASPHIAILAAQSEAARHGCAGIVITQQSAQAVLAAELKETGFRRHCDYYTGNL